MKMCKSLLVNKYEVCTDAAHATAVPVAGRTISGTSTNAEAPYTTRAANASADAPRLR